MGFEPTIVSLQDAKRTGLDDLHESVRLDVMDLLDWQKTYVFECQPPNWGGRVMHFVINLIYPIEIQLNTNIIQVITIANIIHVFT